MSKMAVVLLAIMLIVSATLSNPLMAETWTVNSTASLQQHLVSASAGDTIVLKPARYLGNFEVNTPLQLQGSAGVVIDAQGIGSALKVAASNVSVNGLQIKNWGSDLYERDAGILVLEQTANIHLTDNNMQGDGFGIRADNSRALHISRNQISGNAKLHVLDRGDGIHLNGVQQAMIEFNRIEYVRDGVYIESCKGSIVANNDFSQQQYGIHYMYSEQDEAFGNHSENVNGGYAIMSSKSVYLHHNRAENASEYGVLLNITNGARIEFNVLKNIHNPHGQESLGNQGRAMFIYGALDNQIRANEFSDSDIGIAMAMGGEKNRIYENNFINNLTQVKYVGDELLQWSQDGRGNYWSSYMGWDHSQNGIGQQSYQPNDSMDKLFWRYPEAKFLMNSPVVSLLRWVESQMTLFATTGIKDDYPLMQPVLINQAVESASSVSEFVYEH